MVIGNGESRKSIDVKLLPDNIVACNAFCRDRYAEHLICVDRRMVDEAYETQNYGHLYTRQDWLGSKKHIPHLKTVPQLPYKPEIRADEPFHWGSGPYAVLLAAKLSPSVEIVGFDLYSNDKKVNNMYKDTKHYDKSEKSAVDPKYWIHQIGKIFELYPRRKFVIFQDVDWELPKAWNHPNVLLDKISNFV